MCMQGTSSARVANPCHKYAHWSAFQNPSGGASCRGRQTACPAAPIFGMSCAHLPGSVHWLISVHVGLDARGLDRQAGGVEVGDIAHAQAAGYRPLIAALIEEDCRDAAGR